MSWRLILCAFFAIFGLKFHIGHAFSFGAPAGTCWTMYPKHSGIYAQESASPFQITVSPDTYLPGEEISLILADPNGQDFKGIQIGAHRKTGNTEEIIGQFVGFPGNKVRVFTCFGGYKNMVTHWNSQSVSSISLRWRAPNENVGNITFRATFVQDYPRFWTGVEADLYVSNSAPANVVPSHYEAVPAMPMMQNINFDQCGDTKGCFLYPRHCSGYDCLSAVAFTYREQSDDFMVEMFSDAADNYVSLGFSSDLLMGHHDETYSCVSVAGSLINVQHGFNPEYYNERLLTMYVSDIEVKQADGRLQCRFVLPRLSELQEVVQDADSFQYNKTLFDHYKSWHLQLAWGKTMPDTDVLSYHHDMPAQTDSTVDMRRAKIYRGSAFHVLVQTHAAVMIIAWVFLTGIVTVISRHYKDLLPDSLCCGTKIWFQIHRELAFLIAILTAIGLIVIFAHYGSGIREMATPHAYVGLAVTAGVGVQIVAGLLRPSADHKLRPVFNWGHWLTGHVTHILAAATMFLAFDIEYITKSMRIFGYTALAIWVVLQIFWYLAFEIVRCRKKRDSDNPESYSINYSTKNNMQIQEDKPKKESATRMENLLLATYIISLAALCVAVLLSFLLY